jgi:AtzE family amidohydrolase
MIPAGLNATEIARRVKSGEANASDIADATIERISALNPRINAFTEITETLARQAAGRVDARLDSGDDPGPLAGVPFAVKDLFDVAGIVTRNGSPIHAERDPAKRNATVVERLIGAGAIPVGVLNMEQYAYGFLTNNEHFGRTLNPHDLKRTPGGSSGGSAAAVAAGLVPLALGSDTNGSIRVPAAFCGIFGLKPTFGRLSRAGTVLFVSSLDHVGPFARSVADLAAAYDVMQGPDPVDPICLGLDPDPVSSRLEDGIEGLRIGIPGGYFSRLLDGPCRASVAAVSEALGAEMMELPDCMDAARGAAFVITSVEAMNERARDLRTRFPEFDSQVRYRFVAGSLIPGPWYAKAQQFRRWFADQARQWFADFDVMVFPVAPFQAPEFGQPEADIDGEKVQIGLTLGRFVQPLALLGYPTAVVPIPSTTGPPTGVQLIGRPLEEDIVLRAAAHLERGGIAQSSVASSFMS